jgi:hypothetical protein
MSKQSFLLLPFPRANVPEISITGDISRRKNQLSLHYSVAGKIENILVPSPAPCPSRQDELWKGTCFEFFLALRDQPQYWEFNMSPSGDWNVYRMDAYRRIGFQKETCIQGLSFELRNEAGSLALDMAVDLKPILPDDQPIECGITAVIQTRDGTETYWALAHPAPQADFHLRESFILALAGQTHPAPQSGPEN